MHSGVRKYEENDIFTMRSTTKHKEHGKGIPHKIEKGKKYAANEYGVTKSVWV